VAFFVFCGELLIVVFLELRLRAGLRAVYGLKTKVGKTKTKVAARILPMPISAFKRD